MDGCAIALCAGGVWGLWDLLAEFVWILPCALGHFFLFCNVFRVRRNYELAWTGVKDTGRGATLSVVGYEGLTRPKSYHLRLGQPD